MKKLIALILALVMVLSLTACGGDKDNTVAGGNTESTGNTTGTVNNSTESTQGTTEGTTETNPPATTPPATTPPATTPPATTPPVTTPPVTTPPVTTPVSVNLTIENWSNYFEFTPYIRIQENSFGEFQYVSRFGDGMGLKKEYAGKVTALSDIAVEVESGPTTVRRVEYNIETKELTINDQSDIEHNSDTIWFFGSSSFSYTGGKTDFKLSLDKIVDFGNMSSPHEGGTESLGKNGTLNGNIYTFYALLASEYKVTRIQGTILVSE